MGLVSLVKRLFQGRGYDVRELARRLDIAADELRAVEPAYRVFTIPKRSGGRRTITAPDDALKALQRRILRRLLSRLASHPAALGFERGHSIVTNALGHARRAVVLRMDLRDFFPSTSTERVRDYFRTIGWNRPATDLLVKLCTYEGGLPQGAPTSPRLSNLVNHGLDARLAGLARAAGATYTRYADDLTFSFSQDDPAVIRRVIRSTKRIVAQDGYRLHQRKKLHIRRRHDRQIVTGLVVNDRVGLPRPIRRWLRAVEHHVATGREATLRPVQLAGWRALQSMIATQRGDAR